MLLFAFTQLSIEVVLQANFILVIDFNYLMSFQGFYIFLYGVSVAFLLYVYAFLLRARTTTHLCPKKNAKGPDTSLLQRVTHRAATHSHSHTGSFYLRLGAVGENPHIHILITFYFRKIH